MKTEEPFTNRISPVDTLTPMIKGVLDANPGNCVVIFDSVCATQLDALYGYMSRINIVVVRSMPEFFRMCNVCVDRVPKDHKNDMLIVLDALSHLPHPKGLRKEYNSWKSLLKKIQGKRICFLIKNRHMSHE